MKKAFKYLFVVVLIGVIAGAVYAADHDTIVYITKTGEKYHTGQCSSLRKSKIEITLGNAVSRGYGPCSRCKPPTLD
jgi:methylphosphotriester-DNA--protein-cysteine methyltransferase